MVSGEVLVLVEDYDVSACEAVRDPSSVVYVGALNYDGVRYLKLSKKA